MQIIPKDANTGAINQLPTGRTSDAPPMLTAREKAVQAFMKGAQQQEQPIVQKPTQVSPEEMSAVIKNGDFEKVTQIYKDKESSPQTAASEAPEAVSKTPLSSEYAVLARKERALRQREAQLRAREEALQTAKPVTEAPKSQFDESKYVPRDRLTQDPFTVLNELGLTYDQLTEMALKAPSGDQMAMSNELKALKAEIAALKGETENQKKSFEQTQQEQNAQALRMIENDTRRLISTDPSFEMIKATPGAVKEVVKLIQDTLEKDGLFLSVEEAASEVENFLVDEALRLTKVQKIQQRLQPKSAPAAKQANGNVQESPQLRTLTNAVSGSRPLTAKERAILAFNGQLQKS